MMCSMKKQRQSGFTLIEMMIAMALGLMITAGVISVFLSVKTSYTQNERIARIQENGRVALYLLAQDLRHANFWGSFVNMNSTGSTFPGLSCGSGSNCCQGWVNSYSSNHLTNRFVATSSADLASNSLFSNCGLSSSALKSGASAVAIKRVNAIPATYSSLTNGTVFLRANSINGTFQAKASGTTAPTAGENDWTYEPALYYVRSYAVTAGDGIPTLCVVHGNPSLVTDCLVEGVDDLQIEYGVDTNGDSTPDGNYQTSNAEDATAIAIYILIKDTSADLGYTNSDTYRLGSRTVGPFNDHYRRALFTTTVIPYNQRYLPLGG